MLLKLNDFEYEGGSHKFYLCVPYVGALFVNRKDGRQGRQWADYFTEGNSLALFFGRTVADVDLVPCLQGRLIRVCQRLEAIDKRRKASRPPAGVA